MNGILLGTDVTPEENLGDTSVSGVNLTGATTLMFWARGANGGERVEFFAFGVGHDEASGIATKPYPDSAHKQSTGFVALNAAWTLHTISLAGLDMSYVLGGFGWVASAAESATNPFWPRLVGDVDFNGTINAVDIQLVIDSALNLGLGFDTDLDDNSAIDAVDIQMDIQMDINAALDVTAKRNSSP